MTNMLDDLGSKSVPALGAILEDLREEEVRDEVELVRLTDAITRIKDRKTVRGLQINLVTDELATRNPIV